MTSEERIAWCIARAEEIEVTMPPIEDPHMWDMPRLMADFWRRMAERLAA